jgi:Ca2+-transporting ATPase
LVREIHNAVRGRRRYKVKGLYRCVSLKYHLEIRIARHHSVTKVSASVLTGNVLILFDPQCNPRTITSFVEGAALDFLKGDRELEACGRAQTAKAAQVGRTEDARSACGVGRRPLRDVSRWHVMDASLVLARLGSTAEGGLTPDAVQRNLAQYGPNVFPESTPRSRWEIFIDQFKSMPVLLLSVSAALSLFTGGIAEAVVIMAVVGINSVIGFVTESEAEKTIDSLKSLVRPSSLVIRGGALIEISADQVVAGDVIVLKPGTYIAADARVLEASHLSADESVLTGESMPVVKSAEALSKVRLPLADRANVVHAGTLITGGHGRAVVVATGRNTELGTVQALVSEADRPESLIEAQLTTLGNQLVLASGAVCGLVLLMGLLRGNGLIQMLKSAISLAVAAIPEGLPAVATTTLAIGINSMRKQKVLIRNLDAVCTLGSVQTICFDKTGTITLNKMSVLRIYSGMHLITVTDDRFLMGGHPFDPFNSSELVQLIRMSVLCNESSVNGSKGSYVIHGSATENALVHMAISAGIDVSALRDEMPLLHTCYRSDNRLFMSTEHACGEKRTLTAMKGSPLDVLLKCSRQVKDGVEVPLTEEDRDVIEAENEKMAGNALRVLGIAYATNGDGCEESDECYVWLGLVGMADPIRPRAKAAVARFHRAGLETIMITGDQSPTAYAVGRELGLNNGKPLEILDSTALDDTDPEVIKALAKQAHVFSRVSPSHKLRIVQALQSAGKVVAMTGDGINDGPALKAADIGVAMGSGGTDVAREVADVVLEEDDLETLAIAIRDGRTIYQNIRKCLHYLLATNLSEIEVMFLASALGLGQPLNPMQLLWINLISDIFPGLALALDPPESDVLEQPPRDPSEPIVKAEDLRRITVEATTMTFSSLLAYGYGALKYGAGPAAGTIAFQSLTNAQILHAFTCRSETVSLFDRRESRTNPYLNVAVIGSVFLQVLAQFVPGLRNLLGMTPLTALDGAVVGAAALAPLLVNEATKKVADGSAR